MNSVRVKICGLMRVVDVEAAVAAGANYLGFVFASSPRRLSLDTAAELLQSVPDRVGRVGLFMDQHVSEIEAVLQQVPLDLLQFHGSEDNAFCNQFGRPFIKAVAMGGHQVTPAEISQYPDAQGLLYDSHAPGAAGGTGETFDWSMLPGGSRLFWLAGGLNADNVAGAVSRCEPWAVDVSSGVEDSPGIKNHDLIRQFIRRAKSVELGGERKSINDRTGE